ncbi:Tgt2/MlaC family protein [Mailhella sp.]|uniref:Tgt2/MlaC family protein n=1 Tax=Mailhella sp. TaxID=1981029 RepID=UPI004063C3F9
MRIKLFFLALALCLITAALPASAAELTARQTAEAGADRIMALLNDPAFKDPATKPAVRQKVEAEVLQLFDFDEFSTRTVGPTWRKFTPDQKEAFKTAFTDLLRNTYIDTLDEYNGEKVRFTGEVSANNGKRVEVQMEFLTSKQAYPVAFRMLEKKGRWVVYDVLIEGISMIKNYRDQFRDILSKGDPQTLIERVQAKAEEQKTKKKEKK